jgi:plasmid stabilization system protein ParE
MIIRPEAEADLVSARDWYERQREGLGAAFLLCVEEVLKRIGRTLEIYTAVSHDVRRTLTRRFPYAMYYRMAGTD